MTNPAILEALAKAMNGPHLPVPGDSKHTLAELRDIKWQNIGKGDRQNFLNQAAAVLELVGPRTLVWESMGHHMDGEADTTCRRYSIRYLDGVGHTWRCIDGGFGYSPSGKAAQAAAQAHADAAHWKNTKIGKLVGVV